MMVFEKLEDFVKLLDSVPQKDLPVFVTKKQNVSDQLVLSGSVVLQARFDDDVAFFNYTEHINPVQLLPGSFVAQLSKVLDASLMGSVDNAIKEKINVFSSQLDSEYNKAVSMLKGKGFNNIIQASLV